MKLRWKGTKMLPLFLKLADVIVCGPWEAISWNWCYLLLVAAECLIKGSTLSYEGSLVEDQYPKESVIGPQVLSHPYNDVH